MLRCAVVVALGLGIMHGAARAQSGTPHLVVGTKEARPFAIRGPDGSWSGLSIDLWRGVADELDLDFSIREHTLEELVDELEAGTIDVAVAALTITPDREARVDFTHPFFVSGLGVAVRKRGRFSILDVFGRFVSVQFLGIVTLVLLLLGVVGAAVWTFERRRNPDQFGGGTASGLGSALWWSAVTMTTVGYGDKAPRTVGGRTVALVWMFTSVIVISGITAAIASSLTVEQVGVRVTSLDDLRRLRVGAPRATTSDAFLQAQRVGFTAFPSAAEALSAMRSGALDAVVYDAPILRYLVAETFSANFTTLDLTFSEEYYGFALASGSPLRESINRALLNRIEEDWWEETKRLYLGH